MISGSDMRLAPSTALPGAHDFDAVAGLECGVAPGGARHDRAIERHRNSALTGVDGFVLEQLFKGGRSEQLGFAIDTNVRRDGLLVVHGRFFHSAARAGKKRSRPNGRIAGSSASSRMRRAIASVVTGVSRMPLRWWPVA